MAAGPETVAGSKVAGATSISGGANEQNGPAMTLNDQVAERNAIHHATQTLPDHHGERETPWAQIYKGITTDGGF